MSWYLERIPHPILKHSKIFWIFALSLDQIFNKYKAINKAEFNQLIQELDIQEPLEDLLAMLTK